MNLNISEIRAYPAYIPTTLDMNRNASVTVGLDVPGNLPVGLSEGIVPVIVDLPTASTGPPASPFWKSCR